MTWSWSSKALQAGSRVHKEEFKLDDPNGGREQTRWPPPPAEYKKLKDDPEIEEVAVLVGNFRPSTTRRPTRRCRR